MTQLTEDGRWAQWAEWFEFAYNDVQLMAHDRHVWKNVKAMLEAPGPEDISGVVSGWLVRSIARNQALGLRRQTDTKDRCPTLASVLKELAEYPDIATRARFTAMAPNPETANAAWLRFSPDGEERMDREKLAADIEALNQVRATIARWVNKRVAHLDLGYNAAEMHITMADLWAGLDVLCQVTQRYYSLFHPQEYLAQVTPDLPLGWLNVFQTPWKTDAYVEIEAAEFG